MAVDFPDMHMDMIMDNTIRPIIQLVVTTLVVSLILPFRGFTTPMALVNIILMAPTN